MTINTQWIITGVWKNVFEVIENIPYLQPKHISLQDLLKTSPISNDEERAKLNTNAEQEKKVF